MREKEKDKCRRSNLQVDDDYEYDICVCLYTHTILTIRNVVIHEFYNASALQRETIREKFEKCKTAYGTLKLH